MARRNVALFRREDYETLRRLLTDSQLPASFDEWQKATEKVVTKMEARGDVVVKVVIDPNEFSAWCKACGVDHDFATLGGFTVAMARKQSERGT